MRRDYDHDERAGKVRWSATGGRSHHRGRCRPTAIFAEPSGPTGVAVDTSGNIFIADNDNQRVRKVDPTGFISTSQEEMETPHSVAMAAPPPTHACGSLRVAVDGSGNVFIADSGNSRIRKVTASTRKISTVAGGGIGLGDNGPATKAGLSSPTEWLCFPLPPQAWLAVCRSPIPPTNGFGVSRCIKGDGVFYNQLHDMRRTAARNFRRARVAEGVIMRVGRRRTRSVFERYNIISQADVEDALEKLERRRKDSEAAGVSEEFGHDSVMINKGSPTQPVDGKPRR
jgi:hypothetical protein